MQIYDDEEMRKLVEKLNALYSSFDEWKYTKARKKHEDEFGGEIQEGQRYFKRQYGAGYDEVLKLSRASMEMLLFCLFNGNFALEKMCERLVESNWERLRELMAHSPLWKALERLDSEKRTI